MTTTKDLEKTEIKAPAAEAENVRLKSTKLFERAEKVLPGGVNSPVRSCRAVGVSPIFFTKADGITLTDADGNSYTDFLGSWGAMLLGHKYPRIQEGLELAVAHGTSFGA